MTEKLSEIHYDPKYINVLHQEWNQDSYSACGWALTKAGDTYYLSPYSHCSCYGTWDEITSPVYPDNEYKAQVKYQVRYIWGGDFEELVEMASKKLDPHLPDRQISVGDYDFDYIYNMYKWILANSYIFGKEYLEEKARIQKVELDKKKAAWTPIDSQSADDIRPIYLQGSGISENFNIPLDKSGDLW